MDYPDTYSLLNTYQHGFRQNGSGETQLITTVRDFSYCLVVQNEHAQNCTENVNNMIDYDIRCESDETPAWQSKKYNFSPNVNQDKEMSVFRILF